MISAAFKGLGRPAAVVAAAVVVLLGVGVSSASAASVTVTPSTGLVATGVTSVTVDGSAFTRGTRYRVGLCSTRPYGPFNVPACGEMIEVLADGDGAFRTTLGVEKVTTNVHAGIMPPFNAGQPPSFTCLGRSGDQCAVSAATHGGTPVILARQNVTFL